MGSWMSRISRYIVTVCTVTRHPLNQVIVFFLNEMRVMKLNMNGKK